MQNSVLLTRFYKCSYKQLVINKFSFISLYCFCKQVLIKLVSATGLNIFRDGVLFWNEIREFRKVNCLKRNDILRVFVLKHSLCQWRGHQAFFIYQKSITFIIFALHCCL